MFDCVNCNNKEVHVSGIDNNSNVPKSIISIFHWIWKLYSEMTNGGGADLKKIILKRYYFELRGLKKMI